MIVIYLATYFIDSIVKTYQMEKKIGRNDPCPCGSKKSSGRSKSYKDCYLNPDEKHKTCLVYLEENKEKNKKRVQTFFDNMVNEISVTMSSLQEHYTETFRSQCVILFSFLETLSKIRGEFINEKNENGNSL